MKDYDSQVKLVYIKSINDSLKGINKSLEKIAKDLDFLTHNYRRNYAYRETKLRDSDTDISERTGGAETNRESGEDVL